MNVLLHPAGLPLSAVLGAALIAGPAHSQSPSTEQGFRTRHSVPAELEHDLVERPSGVSFLDGWTAVGEQDGLLLAAADAYSASFGTAGLEFRPAVGPDATELPPLRLDTARVSLGETLLLGAPEQTHLHIDGDLLQADLGAGITERYRVSPEGLQLEYEVRELPHRQGPLTVELRLDTELRHVGRDALGRDRFERSDAGQAVLIGGVLGVDARGRSATGTSRVEGDMLVLELPAEFIATAELPLVLDPLITPAEDLPGASSRHLDFAWSGSANLWGATWANVSGGSEVGVYFATFADGEAPDFPLSIVATSGRFGSPTLAYNNQTDLFLVTYVESDGVLGPFDLLCRAYTAAPIGASIASGVTTLASSLSVHPDPDSGSESTVADDDVLVIYLDNGDVRSAQVSVPTTSDPFVVNDVLLDTGFSATRPAISKGGGSSGRFLAVWQRESSGQSDLRMRVVDRNNVLLGNGGNVTTLSFEQRDPDVDGDGNEWLVAFEQDKAPGDSDILARRVLWNGTNVSWADGPVIQIEADANDDEVDPAVAWVGSKYMVAWADERGGFGSGPFEYDVYFAGFDAETCIPCEAETLLSGGSAWRGELAMGTQVASTTNASLDRAMLGWDVQELTIPSTGDGQTALLDGIGVGGPAINTGGGCGLGGTLTRNGPIAVGGTTQYVLSGANPASTLAILGIAPSTAPFVCDGCAWVPFKYSFVVPVTNGSAFQNVDAPCNVDLVGRAFEVQWTVVSPGDMPCSISPDLALSNRLAIEIGL